MKPRVTIQRPSKTAMQSGRAKTTKWMLTFDVDSPQVPERLMGWQSGRDTRRQVALQFASAEEAVQYAESKGYDYRVIQPLERKPKRKSYADNFTKPLV